MFSVSRICPQAYCVRANLKHRRTSEANQNPEVLLKSHAEQLHAPIATIAELKRDLDLHVHETRKIIPKRFQRIFGATSFAAAIFGISGQKIPGGEGIEFRNFCDTVANAGKRSLSYYRIVYEEWCASLENYMANDKRGTELEDELAGTLFVASDAEIEDLVAGDLVGHWPYWKNLNE